MNNKLGLSLVIGVALIGVTTVWAQPVSPPGQPQELSSYTLTLSAAELTLLGEALSEMPFKKSAPLLNKLQGQVQSQQQQAQMEQLKQQQTVKPPGTGTVITPPQEKK